MKKVSLRLNLSLCLLYSSVLWASPSGDALKALLASVNSMEAKFQQKVSNENGKILQTSAGVFALKKPKQFRWEIKGNAARLVVSNGKKVWDYDEDLAQVSVRSLSTQEQKLPIFFLSGDTSALEKNFEIKQCAATQNTCFELVPRVSENQEKQDIFQKIRLQFKDKVLVELETLDELGQKTIFKFSDVKTNPAIPDNRFQFVPPKGVDIIGAE
jgi:outer membrane lipoprotein carrier protein